MLSRIKPMIRAEVSGSGSGGGEDSSICVGKSAADQRRAQVQKTRAFDRPAAGARPALGLLWMHARIV